MNSFLARFGHFQSVAVQIVNNSIGAPHRVATALHTELIQLYMDHVGTEGSEDCIFAFINAACINAFHLICAHPSVPVLEIQEGHAHDADSSMSIGSSAMTEIGNRSRTAGSTLTTSTNGDIDPGTTESMSTSSMVPVPPIEPASFLARFGEFQGVAVQIVNNSIGAPPFVVAVLQAELIQLYMDHVGTEGSEDCIFAFINAACINAFHLICAHPSVPVLEIQEGHAHDADSSMSIGSSAMTEIGNRSRTAGSTLTTSTNGDIDPGTTESMSTSSMVPVPPIEPASFLARFGEFQGVAVQIVNNSIGAPPFVVAVLQAELIQLYMDHVGPEGSEDCICALMYASRVHDSHPSVPVFEIQEGNALDADSSISIGTSIMTELGNRGRNAGFTLTTGSTASTNSDIDPGTTESMSISSPVPPSEPANRGTDVGSAASMSIDTAANAGGNEAMNTSNSLMSTPNHSTAGSSGIESMDTSSITVSMIETSNRE